MKWPSVEHIALTALLMAQMVNGVLDGYFLQPVMFALLTVAVLRKASRVAGEAGRE